MPSVASPSPLKSGTGPAIAAILAISIAATLSHGLWRIPRLVNTHREFYIPLRNDVYPKLTDIAAARFT